MVQRTFLALVWMVALAGPSLSGEKFEAACPPSAQRVSSITPIPKALRLGTPLVELGRILFHEPKLSRDQSIACSSCHDLSAGGDDGRPTSVGIEGRLGDVNAPSVINRAFDFKQFWDGRAENLRAQADGPLHHPKEMDSSWPMALANLKGDTRFEKVFAKAYPGQVPTKEHLLEALVAYEEQLVAPDSSFDRYLCGDDAALTADAKKGFERFKALGCISCHQGQNVGGNLFQRFGVFGSPSEESGREMTRADLGRFNVTGDPLDRHVFKVPSLRNVATTAPYFHDGSAEDLDSAVRLMARVQLGRELADQDVAVLVAFLESLTGVLPPEALP